jgi:hypothetical protein
MRDSCGILVIQYEVPLQENLIVQLMRYESAGRAQLAQKRAGCGGDCSTILATTSLSRTTVP